MFIADRLPPAALLITVLGVSGYALAQTAQPAATAKKPIVACAKKKGGALRVANRCHKNERRLRWAVAGRRGARGVDGPTGPAGAAGAAGAAGPAGAAGHDGTAGTNGAPGTNGTTTGETLYAETLGLGTNFGTVCGTPSGPSITFTAPTAAYVQVMAQADMQRSGSASNAVCLKVDGDPATPIMSSTSLSYETVSPANPIVLPVSAGSHTISLQYTSSGSSSNFKNRRLWVTVFHPTA